MKWVSCKYLIVWIYLIFLHVGTATAQGDAQIFDRSGFYTAMSGQSLTRVDGQLDTLKHLTFSEKKAFEGALLMKKASLVPNPRNKLSLFKKGHGLLESALQQDSSEVEFHFMRLMIQEHAPPALNYRGQLKADCRFIYSAFPHLAPALRRAMLDYSKKSKILKLQAT